MPWPHWMINETRMLCKLTVLLLQLIQLTAVELGLDVTSKTAQAFSASKALKQHLIGEL